MFAQSSRAALALLVLTVAAAPAVAEEAMTPIGFWGFDSPSAVATSPAEAGWSAEDVDFSGASNGSSQVSTFDLYASRNEAAPGFETTAQGEIDWAHLETVNAAASRLRAREGVQRGVGMVSFDRSSHSGGLGWGLNR